MADAKRVTVYSRLSDPLPQVGEIDRSHALTPSKCPSAPRSARSWISVNVLSRLSWMTWLWLLKIGAQPGESLLGRSSFDQCCSRSVLTACWGTFESPQPA